MDEPKYYFITVFEKLDEKWGIKNARTFGFFTSFEKADSVVRGNQTDLWERLYDYAIIEEYDEGLYGWTTYREFYKYNIEEDIYEPIDEPNEVKHYAGFAMG
jgi:hypothetical protein